KSPLFTGVLAFALAATFVGDVNAGKRKGPNPGKPGKAKFVVEELTTKQFRADNIAKVARPEGRLLHSQRRIAALMAVNTAPAGYEDAFPFWEFRLEPGKYRMVFKYGDAKWTNKVIVGTVKEKGQPTFDCQFGAIGNRRVRGDVVFELT